MSIWKNCRSTFLSFTAGVVVMGSMTVPSYAGESIMLQLETLIGNEPYMGAEDTLLVSGTHANRNYGGTNSLWIGSGDEGDMDIRRSLIRFDILNIIPEGKQVERAILTLTCVQAKGGVAEWALYAVSSENASWVEGDNARGASETGPCSWNYQGNFYQPWTGGEGLGDPGDGYDSTPHYTHSSPLKIKDKISIELPGELIESWRSGNNGGMLLRLTEETHEATYIRFASTEHTDALLRPSLEIILK